MKKVKIVSLMILTVLATSCKKEIIETTKETANKTEKSTFVTHHYTFGEKSYELIYEFNAEYKIIGCEGDVEAYKELTARLSKGEEVAYLIEASNESNSLYQMRIFDSSDELDAYCKTSMTNNNRACDSYSNSGSSTFSFYQHINMSGEYMHLRRPFCSYFQQQWLDSANDQISSLSFSGSFVDLFGGSCFSGIQYRTFNNIPNLHTVLVGYYWFDPVYGGDWCSSIKGYGA